MPTASANITETPISGKYGRVLVSINGTTLYPVNFNKWAMNIETEDIPTTGFEDAGWGNGITGIVSATLTLEGNYQVSRTTGLAAPGMIILTPGRFFYYNLFQVHPDYNSSALGSLLRWAGVAQVIGSPNEQEVSGRGTISVTAKSRGKIWLPGNVETLSAAQQLALYSTGILSSDIPA